MKPYEKTDEDPATCVIFALNSPPVQLSAVRILIFFLRQTSKRFLDIFWNFSIYRFKINVNRMAEKIPAKISSNITPKVLFILSNLFIG